DVADAARAGKVDRAGVLDLAEAVVRRELRSAKGTDALDRIRESRACLRSVELEMRERAKSADEAGAAALLALVEAGLVGKEPLVERYGRSSDGAFRAVGARAAVSTKAADLRRSFYS